MNKLEELSRVMGRDVEELYSDVRRQVIDEILYDELSLCKALKLLQRIRCEDSRSFDAALILLSEPLASFRSVAARANVAPVTLWRRFRRLSNLYPEIRLMMTLRANYRRHIR